MMVSQSFQSAEMSCRAVVRWLSTPKNLHALASSSRPPVLPAISTRSPTSSLASPAPQEPQFLQPLEDNWFISTSMTSSSLRPPVATGFFRLLEWRRYLQGLQSSPTSPLSSDFCHKIAGHQTGTIVKTLPLWNSPVPVLMLVSCALPSQPN